MSLSDPFTPSLKIDLLPDIQECPIVLCNVTGSLGSFRCDIDNFLKTHQPEIFLHRLLPSPYREGSNEHDVHRVNAIVLYVRIQAMRCFQNPMISYNLANTL